jgi:hypothetical protein
MAKRKAKIPDDAQQAAWMELLAAEQKEAPKIWQALFEGFRKDYPDNERAVTISQNRYDALRETAVFAIGLAAAFGKHHRQLIRDMEKRIAAMERGEVLGTKFCGVWQRQMSYAAGNLATHKGAMWHCNVAATGVEPGDGKIWTLAAKGDKPVLANGGNLNAR